MIKFTMQAAGILAMIVFGGCVAGDDSGSGTDFSSESTIQVTEIVPPSASAPGSISTVSIDNYCEDGELVSDTTVEESNYLISGGHLYLWVDGDCLMTKLNGTSSTIIGTWTGTSLASTDTVPLPYRPSICDDDEYADDIEVLQDFSVEYKISSTRIKAKSSGTVCFAKSFTAAYDSSRIEGYEVVSEGCTSVKIRNVEKNKVATITSGFKNDSATITFSYDGKTCTGSVYLGLGQVQTCSEDDGDDGLEAYGACTLTSGFYGDLGDMAKKAFTRKISRALRGPAPGPFAN